MNSSGDANIFGVVKYPVNVQPSVEPSEGFKWIKYGIPNPLQGWIQVYDSESNYWKHPTFPSFDHNPVSNIINNSSVNFDIDRDRNYFPDRLQKKKHRRYRPYGTYRQW